MVVGAVDGAGNVVARKGNAAAAAAAAAGRAAKGSDSAASTRGGTCCRTASLKKSRAIAGSTVACILGAAHRNKASDSVTSKSNVA